MKHVNQHSTVRRGQDEFDLGARIESLRKDFPILQASADENPLVYLDNAATSQKPQYVIDRISTFYRDENANVHRGVHSLSQTATEAYENTRRSVAGFIGSDTPSQIVFTRGTTESINLVAQSYLRPTLRSGDEVLISAMEHHSNIVPWQLVCEQTGARLKVIPVDDNGTLEYEEFQRLLNEKTRILAITHISNTLGTVNPVKRLIADAHGLGIPVLIDGAQAVPHQRVDVGVLDCDFYCFSGHKMYGPTGVGVLYGKRNLLDAMPPWQGGGDMIESVSFEKTTFNDIPHRFEAGTPNIAGVVGLAAAINYIDRVGYEMIEYQEKDLLDYALTRLAEIEGIRLIGTAPDRVSVISFLLCDAHPYDVGTILDRLGIAVRTGHHCTQPLMDRFSIPGTIRASFSFYNTREEVDRLASALNKARRLLCQN